MIGIKGTGMSALAELLAGEGAAVSGSDVGERFYTDAILEKNRIPVNQGFRADQVPEDADLVVYSPAYDIHSHPELLRARALGHAPLEYTKALGEYSSSLPLAAVSGIHGKTTTTAMIGAIIKALDLPAKVLVGSAVSNFGGSPTFNNGNRFMVAETCEYRRHFLDFSPDHILITSIEPDHLDYFSDEDDVRQAFCEFMDLLPSDGRVVYCADDPGAKETVEGYVAQRTDVTAVPYGFEAAGDYRLEALASEDGVQRFSLSGYRQTFSLPYPGIHSLRNAAGAMALLGSILGRSASQMDEDFGADMAKALAGFSGTTRRNEIVADIGGVRIIDDYAHHPTAIRTTLAGFRTFYGSRRLIVDFMSHTYSRTSALLDEFARAFADADILILNEIYASAREHNDSGVSGESLFRKAQEHHEDVRYIADFDEAATAVFAIVKPGDVFVTMGAGNNWEIGRMLRDKLLARDGSKTPGSRASGFDGATGVRK